MRPVHQIPAAFLAFELRTIRGWRVATRARSRRRRASSGGAARHREPLVRNGLAERRNADVQNVLITLGAQLENDRTPPEAAGNAEAAAATVQRRGSKPPMMAHPSSVWLPRWLVCKRGRSKVKRTSEPCRRDLRTSHTQPDCPSIACASRPVGPRVAARRYGVREKGGHLTRSVWGAGSLVGNLCTVAQRRLLEQARGEGQKSRSTALSTMNRYAGCS